MSLSRVGVIGAGIMGSGIAQVSAASGREVVMLDVSEEVLGRGLDSIAASLQRFISKGQMTTSQRDAALARIRTSTAYAQLASSDLVIEAATEDLEIKRQIIHQVDALLP